MTSNAELQEFVNDKEQMAEFVQEVVIDFWNNDLTVTQVQKFAELLRRWFDAPDMSDAQLIGSLRRNPVDGTDLSDLVQSLMTQLAYRGESHPVATTEFLREQFSKVCPVFGGVARGGHPLPELFAGTVAHISYKVPNMLGNTVRLCELESSLGEATVANLAKDVCIHRIDFPHADAQLVVNGKVEPIPHEFFEKVRAIVQSD